MSLKEQRDNYRPDEGDLPWEHGYYGTVDGREKGLSDGSYEIIGDGCFRRMPADPGGES